MLLQGVQLFARTFNGNPVDLRTEIDSPRFSFRLDTLQSAPTERYDPIERTPHVVGVTTSPSSIGHVAKLEKEP
jgi:hypothetical protein